LTERFSKMIILVLAVSEDGLGTGANILEKKPWN
jgi:hypothetical protein